jgi:hypothetical protein
MAVAMIFVVTGPTNSKEQRTILVEAPTSDAAALGAGVALGVEVGGHAQIDDFRDHEGLPIHPLDRRYPMLRVLQDHAGKVD